MVNCPKCQQPCTSYTTEMDFCIGNIVVPKQNTMFIKCENCNVEVTMISLNVVDNKVIIRTGLEGKNNENKNLGGNDGRS